MDILIQRLPQLWGGLMVTIEVAILSLVVALIMGLIGATAKLSTRKYIQFIATVYTSMIRGVPEIVLMLILFFGVQILLNHITELYGYQMINISAMVTGVWVIGFIYGAYMTETFRGAWQAIPIGQFEAAKSCGMSTSICFKRIVWPQLMRYALPGIVNNWLVLLKATALISMIGLKDLVWWANVIGKSEKMPFTFLLAILLVYLILTEISQRLLRFLEKKYNIGTISFIEANGH